MVLLVSALAALCLLLLALKLSRRLGRPRSAVCPHLGQMDDPFSHLTRPAEEHRCYLGMQRDRVDLTHQRSFCLSTAHTGCPWLMVVAPQVRKSPQQAKVEPWQPARRPRVPLAAFRRLGTAGRAGAVAGRRGLMAAGRGLMLGGRALAGTPGRLAGPGSVVVGQTGAMWRRCFPAAVTAASGVRIALVASSRGAWRLACALSRLLARGLRQLFATLLRACRGVADALRRARRARTGTLAARAAALAQPASPPVAAALEVVLEQGAAEPLPIGPRPVETPHTPMPALEQATGIARLEELLAEAIALLDRGDESLAYHMFRTATEQPAQRGQAGYEDVMKRAWFWRAKTAETVEEVVRCLEQALRLDPRNMQVQAHLAWARQRLEREQALESYNATAAAPAVPWPAAPAAARRSRPSIIHALRRSVRMSGGLMALGLALLWATTGLLPAIGQAMTQLPAVDQELLHLLLLTLNGRAMPAALHSPVPLLHEDLAVSLPFILAFLFLFTARGLIDGERWARLGGFLLAAAGAWLCTSWVASPDAARVGFVLCLGMLVAALAGRFDSAGQTLPRFGTDGAW